jgi:hypothetical protein
LSSNNTIENTSDTQSQVSDATDDAIDRLAVLSMKLKNSSIDAKFCEQAYYA